MIKRALLCGLGKSYTHTILPPLPLELDIQCIIKRLNAPELSEKWESIDVIDDSPMSVYDGEKNKVILANELMPSKENIKKSMMQIVEKGADLVLFYFSGHGEKPASDLFMFTYNQEFFNQNKKLIVCEAKGLFFKDDDYITFFTELLQNNPQLIIISIIDCCDSASLFEKIKSPNDLLDRNIIFCSGANEARTDSELGSFFTKCVVKSAVTSDTYSKFKTNLKVNLGTDPTVMINTAFENIQLPF